jgi:hypothetical protein
LRSRLVPLRGQPTMKIGESLEDAIEARTLSASTGHRQSQPAAVFTVLLTLKRARRF